MTFNCISGLLCSLNVALCDFTVLNLIYLSRKLNRKKKRKKNGSIGCRDLCPCSHHFIIATSGPVDHTVLSSWKKREESVELTEGVFM